MRPSARRHGHVLCNILLSSIPPDARIRLISAGTPVEPDQVREQYARLRPLEGIGYEARGWALDVLNVVRLLGKREFTLGEVYAYEEMLLRLHPANRFIRPKIRQQLQRLRDMGLVSFRARGRYETV